MSPRRSKKRPCRICRKRFIPDPRVGDRQKTCGDHECMRIWHAQKCTEWNRKNRNYAQENYLHDRSVIAVSQDDAGKKAPVADATANSD